VITNQANENIDDFGQFEDFNSVELLQCEGEMRVPDSALRSVVYIGQRCPPEKPETFSPIGTGFIVERERPPKIGKVLYLVTADHVRKRLIEQKKFSIRVNRADGRSTVFSPPDFYDWWPHPTDKTVDAAVFPFGLTNIPFTSFPATRFVGRELVEPKPPNTGVGIGDEVFIVGLLRTHQGKGKITPAVRTGHIAMMAQERIKTENYGYAKMRLIEAFTLSGFSGSPVFVRETLSFPRRTARGSGFFLALGDIYLLGLLHGIVHVSPSEEVKSIPDLDQRWHAGISTVVPAEHILEIIDQPKLIKYEEKIVRMMQKKPKDKGSTSETAIDTEKAPKRKNRDIIPPPISRGKFFDALEKTTKRDK
jgi:hypothetical protein